MSLGGVFQSYGQFILSEKKAKTFLFTEIKSPTERSGPQPVLVISCPYINGYFSSRQAGLKILQCILVVKILIFLDLTKTISFLDGHYRGRGFHLPTFSWLMEHWPVELHGISLTIYLISTYFCKFLRNNIRPQYTADRYRCLN